MGAQESELKHISMSLLQRMYEEWMVEVAKEGVASRRPLKR